MPNGRADRVLRCLRDVSAGYFALVLVLAAFFAGSVRHECRVNGIAELGPVFFVVAIALVALLAFVFAHVPTRSRLVERLRAPRAFGLWLAVMAVVLLGLQHLLFWEAGFKTGWDVWHLTDVHSPQDHEEYFSWYPNQLFMYGLFRAIAAASHSVPFLVGEYGSLVQVGMACVVVALVLMSLTARRLFGLKAGYLASVVGFFMIGLSPWVMVPYSDTYGMLFTTAVLFFYVCVDNKVAKVGGMFFFTVLGYYLKPTIIFVLAAIAVVEAASWLAGRKERAAKPQRSNRTEGRRSWLAVFGAALIASALALGLNSLIRYDGPELDETQAFSMAHFLAMGANAQSTGIYSAADVDYTGSFSDPAERTKADIDLWKQRMAELGPAGVASLALSKTLNNYADGSFGWEMEGDFYLVNLGKNETLQSFYGIFQANGSTGFPFRALAQVMWFAVLACMAACLLKRSSSKAETAAFLALLFLSLFLTVFESRARYLFLYMPFFVMLGAAGFWRLRGLMAKRSDDRRASHERPTCSPSRNPRSPRVRS